MSYKEIYEKAYEYMSENVIDGNCGDLCKCHCCRPPGSGEEDMGIYFLPFEYEEMQELNQTIDHTKTEVHTSEEYEFTETVPFLFYGFCNGVDNCNRDLRPIQCRSYPLAPYIEDNMLYLIIDEQQEHDCPLIKDFNSWRLTFIQGIYKGWEELLKIDQVKALIEADSIERKENTSISKKVGKTDIF